jgi:thioredoxin reductase (NADPH)
VVIEHNGSRESLAADQVLLLTGYHADFDLLRACGIEIDEASGVPLHDPSTLESTTVPGVFFAGGVLAGKDTAPIFIENGRFHGERIIKVLSERR